jgi:site-specific DNA-methyltransferase (adenine-specific)
MTDSEPAQIVERSSESMTEVADAAVTLTVTSPPYFNAVDYGKYARQEPWRERGYSKGFEPGTYEAYLALMQRIFREVHRVTKPGGLCVIVVGSVLDKGVNYAIPFDLTARMQDLGWQLFHELIWHKGFNTLDRAGGFIRYGTPGSFHPNVATEHILVFRRLGPKLFTAKDGPSVPVSGLVTREVVNNVWHILPVPPWQVDHPCPFPEEIPYRLLLLYSVPGSLVLDPFCGSGQTGKVAIALGRRFVGYEVEPAFVQTARARLRQPLQLRSAQLVARMDHIVNDPFNQLAQEGDRHD